MSKEVIAEFKASSPDWTRKRILTFDTVATLIIRGHQLPLQNNVNKFYKEMGEMGKIKLEDVVSASAYCQARRKLKPELFLYLNSLVGNGFYRLYEAEAEAEEENQVEVKRWKGRRLLGVDGTYLNLPDTPETRQKYSVQTNQHQHNVGGRVQALSSVLYDLLNDIGLNATISPKCAEKKLLFDFHLQHTQHTPYQYQYQEGDVLVMDRAYADYSVMAFLIKQRRDFVIRFPKSSFKEVEAFWRRSSQKDKIIELKVGSKQKQFVKQHQLAEVIRIRLVKVRLNDGEIEVLGTTLLDKKEYPLEEFKSVYGWRWKEETYFDRIKNIFEVERFSGKSVICIEQDFYGMLFLATLESVLSKSAERELEEESQLNHNHYEKQVNHSVSYSTILDYIFELLMDKGKSVEQTLEEIHHLFKTNPTIRREGREYPRKELTESQKLWFHRYQRRIIA